MRAIEGRATGLHQALDELAAVARGADDAGAVVDVEPGLEIAELAAGLDMVAQGRAAVVDLAQQHLLDGGDQPIGALALALMRTFGVY